MSQVSGGSATQKPTCDSGVLGVQKEPHLKMPAKTKNAFVECGFAYGVSQNLHMGRYVCYTDR
jgi:hypothetical protein